MSGRPARHEKLIHAASHECVDIPDTLIAQLKTG